MHKRTERFWDLYGAWVPVVDRDGALLLATQGVPPIAGGAETVFATGHALAVRRWSGELWAELPREIYWGKFMDKSDRAIIQVKSELDGKPGEVITFPYSRKLSGSGTSDDDVLEGNEEELKYFSDALTLTQRRNAVRLGGKLSERRTMFDQRMDAKNHLRTWLAETIDDLIFTGFDTSPTTVVFGGTATSIATITATMVVTPAKIDSMVAKAKKASPKIWPSRVNGREWFLLVLHTDVAYDLEQDATWHAAQRDAGVRGDENKIFTGMLGTWRQTVIHEHEKVPTATNYGSGANLAGASNFFLGMQAGFYAWGSRPEAWEKEFDYGAKIGFAIGAVFQFKKAVFATGAASANVDHALIAFRCARTNN